MRHRLDSHGEPHVLSVFVWPECKPTRQRWPDSVAFRFTTRRRRQHKPREITAFSLFEPTALSISQ